MKEPQIKQFGLHRSGTNFLRVILQENYHVEVLSREGGWKHGPYEVPKRLGRELDCVICVKNPYAWLVSIYNYRHPKKDIPFPAFVRSPIHIVHPGGPDRAIHKPNPVRLWVEMNEHWLSVKLQSHRLFVFAYEKVLAAPRESIQELVTTLKLERRVPLTHRLKTAVGAAAQEPEFFVPPRQLGALRDDYKKKNLAAGTTFDPGQYTRQEFFRAFTPDLLDFVNENLQSDLVTRLGYTMANPSGKP
jgi:hypothetical protein